MKEIWNQIKNDIATQLADQAPTLALLQSLEWNDSLEDRSIQLELPSKLQMEMAERSIMPLVREQLKKTDQDLQVKLALSKVLKPKAKVESPQLPLSASQNLEAVEPLFQFKAKYSLNREFTLENFVVGPQTHFAVQCLRIFADPGSQNMGPLFIHGHSGLGKTHLLHALGWQILKSSPELRVKIVSGEEFINDYHSDLSKKLMTEFRGKYRLKTDLLLIDDIHSIGRAKGAQEELFNILNAYASSGKLIAFTCDKSPDQLSDFEERLKSRLQGGLSCEVTIPDVETRFSIAVQKSLQFGCNLSLETLQFLSERLDQDLRALSGAINKLGVLKKMMGQEPELSEVKKILNLNDQPENEISVENILASTARRHSLKISDLKSDSRVRPVVNARTEAMKSLREQLGLSFAEIGRVFGKDHSTVMYALSK